MACRILYRSVLRRTQQLLCTSSFSSGMQGQLLCPHLQEIEPPSTPSQLSGRSAFSSTPFLFSTEDEITRRSAAPEGISDISNTGYVTTQEHGGDLVMSPADLMSSCLDTLHNLTGLPWWATISVSAIVLRAFFLPMRIVQNQKVAEIRKLGPRLQLERLAKGASQFKFLEEWRHLMKRKQGLNCPSLLWIIGPGIIIQVPLVLTLMYSLRKMALEQHLGFANGGMLWFDNLTVSGEGLTGAVLPLVVATTYFANVHVLFRELPVRRGPLASLEKAWKTLLKCSTVFIFFSFCYLPQAVLMFSVPHSILTLSQTIMYEKKQSMVRMAKGNPETKVVLSDYENLLKEAGTNFTRGDASKAIELLQKAIKEEPEEQQAYALLGLVYKGRKDWKNSAMYYKEAILKGKTENFQIAAYAGCGLALLKAGLVMECVDTMRPIKSFKVPDHPETLHCYYASLVIFARALLEAGFKEESQEIAQQAKEINKNYKFHENVDASSTPRD